MCNLAVELTKRGHDVAFYSYVPPWRTKKFGLPIRSSRWLGPLVAPAKLPQVAGHRLGTHYLNVAIDKVAARVVTRCDILIAMSGIGVDVLDAAKRRFGARVLLERGSPHIHEQRRVLDLVDAKAGATPPDADLVKHAVARELAGYQRADRIVIPALHVEESFIEHGIERDRLFRNPYGVDLGEFPATPAPTDLPPTLINVGTWRYLKGVDVLVEAWRRLAPEGVKLLHVGPVGDAPLPTDVGFTHQDRVDQSELTRWYGRGHVFVLPSWAEGLAIVQPQALASGLPLVGTTTSGARDLGELVGDTSHIRAVAPGDVDALEQAIRSMLPIALKQRGERQLLDAEAKAKLSWTRYTDAYEAQLYRELDG